MSDGEPSRAAHLLSGPRGREVCARVALQPTRDLDLGDDRSQVAKLLGHIDQVDAAAIAALRDPLDLLAALSRSVDSAMYWQEPHEENQLIDDPLIVTALEPVARALAAAPAARWWWSPADLERQAITRWLDQGQAMCPELVGVRERLERWRSDTFAEEERAAEERPAAFDASYSGSWWSTPVLANITTTSRRIDGLAAAQLELVEDSMGWTSARVAASASDQKRRSTRSATPPTGSSWSSATRWMWTAPDVMTGGGPPAAPALGRSPTGCPIGLRRCSD